ncbi:nodulin 21-related protein [hydrothermal vent metagenome]|uniref:Nodulin 21-related protein n=1 Tax=hydrothermal vent metagenome TaxID=652676 RepID=A0A3B1D045_9ZZZZ
MKIDNRTREQLLIHQKNELTEHYIYRKLAAIVKEPENREVLNRIADDELRHSRFWIKYTETEVKPDRIRIWKYQLISRILGFTFAAKLMERGEEGAQNDYAALSSDIKEVETIIREEKEHEERLLNLLDEERLQYTGSMVLGLNDALVELTGALAGFTLALRNTRMIALVGLVTGIAAALSMASSEYLSTKTEDNTKQPLKASVYTGIAYIITVFVLIAPYLIFSNYYVCLGVTMSSAVLIIFLFNYYISVAKDLPFAKHFFEMAGLSLGVATLSFFIGFVLRHFLGVDM